MEKYMSIVDKKINELNEALSDITERYTIALISDEYSLYDSSLTEVEFHTEQYDIIEAFVMGLILGRNTKG